MRYPEPQFFDFTTEITQDHRLVFRHQVRGSTPGAALHAFLDSIPGVLERVSKLESLSRVSATVEFPDHFGTDLALSSGGPASSVDSLENYLLMQAELYYSYEIRSLLGGWRTKLERVSLDDYDDPLEARLQVRYGLVADVEWAIDEFRHEWESARRKSIHARRKIDREDRNERRLERFRELLGARRKETGEVFTTENDPLDPHGDETLRPGDALFDAMMNGESVVANRDSAGNWRRD